MGLLERILQGEEKMFLKFFYLVGSTAGRVDFVCAKRVAICRNGKSCA